MTPGGRLALTVVLAAAGLVVATGVAMRGETRTSEALEPVQRPEGRVRVEVLNAGGVGGLARDATDYLRDEGFDVVYFGNADAFGRDSTLVFDRVNRLETARAVADALGIDNVVSEPDSNRYVDVSVWLGSTWTPPPGSLGRRYDEVAPPMNELNFH